MRQTCPQSRYCLPIRAVQTLILVVVVAAAMAAWACEPPIRLITRGFDGTPAVTGATSSSASVSADGRYVAFVSNALNLHPRANGVAQVYVRDRHTGAVELVTQSSTGEPGDRASTRAVLSADGRVVAFGSSARNLIDASDAAGVFVHDRTTRVTELVSVATDGTPATNTGYGPAISADGSVVAFASTADNLVPGDTNSLNDIFVRDRLQRTTERISLGPNGVQANGQSGMQGLAVSPDGGDLVFFSLASNLVPGDTNGAADLFLFDRERRSMARVSVGPLGAQANGSSFDPDFSGDGRFLAFSTDATNLVSGDGGYPRRVVIRNLATSVNEYVSVAGGGFSENGSQPSVNHDGRFVAFVSQRDVASPDGSLERPWEIVLRDRAAGITERLSVSTGGEWGDRDSSYGFPPDLSGDGSVAVYVSQATNLVSGDENGSQDVFIRDRRAGATERASEAAGGGDGVSGAGSIPLGMASETGDVLFSSSGTNIVPGDTNITSDLFVWNAGTASSERINVSTDGLEAEYAANDRLVGAISGNGRYVVFSTRAGNLTSDDSDTWWDLFLRDRESGATTRIEPRVDTRRIYLAVGSSLAISHDGRYIAFYGAPPSSPYRPDFWAYLFDTQAGETRQVDLLPSGANPNGTAQPGSGLALSADARYVAFGSLASDLVLGDTNNASDIFIWDRIGGTHERVSVASGGVQANGGSTAPSLSADGRRVAFISVAANLVPDDINASADVFVYDRQQRITTRASVGPGGDGAWDFYRPEISANGRYVVFATFAGLVRDDANQLTDVYLRNLGLGRTTRVPVGLGGAEPNGHSALCFVSGDGGRVALYSEASNLTPEGIRGAPSVFVRDMSHSSSTPPAPNALEVNPAFRALRLAWTDRITNECGFRIERKSGTQAFTQVAEVGENITSWTDAAAQPDTLYTYRVRAFGLYGVSAGSNQASGAYGPPAAPTGLSGVVEAPTRVRLLWKDNAGAESGYKVERRPASSTTFTEVGATAANRQLFLDETVSPDQSYYYRVRAVGPTGQSTVSAPLLLSTAVPKAPAYLKAAVLSAGVVKLTWRDMSAGESGFWVERRTGTGGTYAVVAKLGPGVVEWTNRGLAAGKTYFFRVKAVSGAGQSPPSNEVSATP